METPRTAGDAAVLLLAACVPLFFSGCAAGDDAAAGITVRDSAGVRIVENTGAAWADGEAWRISAEPVVDIGVLDGAAEYQLYQVRDVTRFDDGRIAVANAGSGEIRIYDARGELRRSLGSAGAGPGEFERLSGLVVAPGDTVIAFDAGNDRVTVFDPDGALVRTAQLDRSTPAPLVGLERSSDGTFVIGTGFSSAQLDADDSRDGAIGRVPSPILRYAPDGTLIDSVGVWPGFEFAVWDMGGGRTAMGSPLFGRRLVHAVHDDRVYVGTQETFEIAVHSLDGSPERLIRGAPRDLTVTERDIAAVRDHLAGRLPADDPAVARRFEQMFALRPVAERRPAYGALRVDAAGNVWVADGDTPPGAPPQRWTVFDADDRMLGAVDLPRPIRIFEIGDDYLLGRWTDEFDVEHVQLYELIKGD